MVVTLGGNLSLLCNAQGFPAPNISWFKGQSEVDDSRITTATNTTPAGDREVAVSNVLTITGVQLQDADVYTCRATNGFGTDSHAVSNITIAGECVCGSWCLGGGNCAGGSSCN